MTIGSEGLVLNAATANYNDALNQPPSQGKQGEYLAAQIHGKWYNVGLRKALFAFNVTAVTIPVVSANQASVFTLWNPTSSGVHGEIIDTEMGQVLATTVVDAVGWYFSSGSQALAGTFTTKATANAGNGYFAGRVGDIPANQITPYTAYTHSGTPVRVDIIGSFGATTDVSFTLPQKQYDGRLVLPPGVAISAMMSTAAGTTSGLDLSVRWAEWQFA